MKANLLVVTGDEFKNSIISHLENHGFTLYFARGRLKVKEIFTEKKIDAALWLFSENEKELADDLLTILNEHQSIPVVIVTEKFVNYLFLEEIENMHSIIDINDDDEDIRKAVELACNQNLKKNVVSAEKDVSEIKFKNAVTNLIVEKRRPDAKKTENDEILTLNSPWIAVGKKEKDILSDSTGGKKTSKFRELLSQWKNRSEKSGN